MKVSRQVGLPRSNFGSPATLVAEGSGVAEGGGVGVGVSLPSGGMVGLEEVARASADEVSDGWEAPLCSVPPGGLMNGVTLAASVDVTGVLVSRGADTWVSWAMMVWAAAVYTASGRCGVVAGAGVARAQAPRKAAVKITTVKIAHGAFVLRVRGISDSSEGQVTSG
jgi:hypothetical protein